jgi:hypothetical protein
VSRATKQVIAGTHIATSQMLKSCHVYSHGNMVIALDIPQMGEGARISGCSSSCRITKTRRGWLRRGGGDSPNERLQDQCRLRGRLGSKHHDPAKRSSHRNLNRVVLRVQRRRSEVATIGRGSGTISDSKHQLRRGQGVHLPSHAILSNRG